MTPAALAAGSAVCAVGRIVVRSDGDQAIALAVHDGQRTPGQRGDPGDCHTRRRSKDDA